MLDLGFSREDCQQYLADHGFAAVSRSACVGCPYTSNAGWRSLRDDHPERWDQAVAFDRQIRSGGARANANGNRLLGQAFLHPSLLPLDQAPIDPPASGRSRTVGLRLLPSAPDPEDWDGDPDGCSPWSCRSGRPVTDGVGADEGRAA